MVPLPPIGICVCILGVGGGGGGGGALCLGKGVITGISTQQKLTTRSSTKAERVAVDDCMPLILWTCYFLEAQGYGADDTIIYQDNKSAMLLEQNG